MTRRSIFAVVAWIGACGSSVPHPSAAPQPPHAFVEVDFPPPPARVEFVPAQPTKTARWVNGEWLWTGQRWAWKQGAWVVPPEGSGYAKAALFRRADGKLLFAPGAFRNERGEEVQVEGSLDGGSDAGHADGGGKPADAESPDIGPFLEEAGAVEGGTPGDGGLPGDAALTPG